MRTVSKIMFGLPLLIIIALSNVACAQKKVTDKLDLMHNDIKDLKRLHIKPEIENLNYVLAVSKDGKFQVFNKDGRPVKACRLCTKELELKLGDEYCRKAIKYDKEIDGKKICKSLSDSTIQNVDTITTIRTRINPYCDTIMIGGIPFPIGDGCF